MLLKSEVIYLRWLLLSACCWMGFCSSSSDELFSRDCEPHSETDGNYPGSRSTHPSYPGQICLLIITFCPSALLTEVQLKVGSCSAHPAQSHRVAGCCCRECCAAPLWELSVCHAMLLSQMTATYTIHTVGAHFSLSYTFAY